MCYLGKPKCFGRYSSQLLCGHNRSILICDFYKECEAYSNKKDGYAKFMVIKKRS